jgi:hypothetical protein
MAPLSFMAEREGFKHSVFPYISICKSAMLL